jgi:cytoskeletal protein CcmA (bactofilin family)
MIGKSVLVKGEIVGSEDLVIEGKVEGRIDLAGQHLRVGSGGEVRADLRAKHVVVEGEVFGDIRAEDRVEVAATGSVRGDIRAPRVSLAHGARFKGSIDMEGEAPRSQAVPPRAHSGAA